MDITGSTLFSGGEGVGVAMRAAGIRHLQGIEWDNDIADVARMNGFNTKTGDVRHEDYSTWERPTILHASPVCKNASNAKANGEESVEDLETADAVCRAIVAMRPRCVTLENVWGYRHFQAFKNILKCLKEQGYQTDYWHLNSADFGVAQTRRRLILVAALDFKPYRPQPTHDKKYYGGFSDIKPWVGWYEAIEDLIPTLPPSKFARWQLDRLPKHLKTTLFANGGYDGGIVNVPKEMPANSITANQNQGTLRGFLFGSDSHPSESTPITIRDGEQPSSTVTRAANKTRAFILGNDASDDRKGGTYGMIAKYEDEPSITVKASPSYVPRAFLSDSLNYSSKNPNRFENEPAQTVVVHSTKHPAPLGFIVNTREQHQGGDVTAVMGDKPVDGLVASSYPNRHKAFLMPNEDTSSDASIPREHPAHTITSSHGVSSQRAWLDSGRVVKMTPRALARFQSFPDSYILPEKTSLACEVIGNAVPPLLYQRVIESQLDLFK